MTKVAELISSYCQTWILLFFFQENIVLSIVKLIYPCLEKGASSEEEFDGTHKTS